MALDLLQRILFTLGRLWVAGWRRFVAVTPRPFYRCATCENACPPCLLVAHTRRKVGVPED